MSSLNNARSCVFNELCGPLSGMFNFNVCLERNAAASLSLKEIDAMNTSEEGKDLIRKLRKVERGRRATAESRIKEKDRFEELMRNVASLELEKQVWLLERDKLIKELEFLKVAMERQ